MLVLFAMLKLQFSEYSIADDCWVVTPSVSFEGDPCWKRVFALAISCEIVSQSKTDFFDGIVLTPILINKIHY